MMSRSLPLCSDYALRSNQTQANEADQTMDISSFKYINSHFGNHQLAYCRTPASTVEANAPGLIFLPGFKSDLTGTKAQACADWAALKGLSCLRFDYFGHGQSSGDFREGTISGWREEVNTVLRQLTEGPQILIGSSFGGFLASLVALDQPDRVKGLILIAPAIDMTERLMLPEMSAQDRETLIEKGEIIRASEYDPEGYPITHRLIEDGRQHCLLTGPIELRLPIHILHGQCDDAVPWHLSLEFAEACASTDITMEFFKSGDHRLSEPHEIQALTGALERLVQKLRL